MSITIDYSINFINFLENNKNSITLYGDSGKIPFGNSIRCFDVKKILINGVQSLPLSMETFEKVETVVINLSCVNDYFDILLKLKNCKKIIISNSIIFKYSIFADKDFFNNKIQKIKLEIHNCSII